MIPRLSFLGLHYIVLHIKMHIFTYESARIHTSYTESLASCSYIYIWLVAFRHPSEKYEFVSWDDDIPNMWKVVKFMFQTTNQNIS